MQEFFALAGFLLAAFILMIGFAAGYVLGRQKGRDMKGWNTSTERLLAGASRCTCCVGAGSTTDLYRSEADVLRTDRSECHSDGHENGHACS